MTCELTVPNNPQNHLISKYNTNIFCSESLTRTYPSNFILSNLTRRVNSLPLQNQTKENRQVLPFSSYFSDLSTFSLYPFCQIFQIEMEVRERLDSFGPPRDRNHKDKMSYTGVVRQRQERIIWVDWTLSIL